MGRNADFLAGESCFFNDFYFLRNAAERLLKKNKLEVSLEADDFVFWMSQGVMFAFFNLNEGDNPPIYCYKEGFEQKTFEKITNSFSEFLERKFDEDITLFNEVV